MVKLGKAVPGNQIVCLGAGTEDKSILNTGRTGSGKTKAMMLMERRLVQKGHVVLNLNYNATHSDFLGPDILHWSIMRDGFPFQLLAPFRRPDGTMESAADVAEALVTAFSTTSRLGLRQKMALRIAILRVLAKSDAMQDGLEEIGKELAVDEKNLPAIGVYTHFWSLFKMVRTSEKPVVMVPGKIFCLDFDGYPSDVQHLLAELALSVVWRYQQIWGRESNCTLYVVCDEFQDLELRCGGVFHQILTQGRKFHVALLMATQTTEIFKPAVRSVLAQSAVHLMFRPTDYELDRLAKGVSEKNPEEVKKILRTLAVGECLAIGKFRIGASEIERPVKITFWEDEGEKNY